MASDHQDELSPIDRVRSLGQPTDALPDIGSLKNRRQWKSLVLGKKDMPLNNFATITEEKEEEISSDGSQGANSSKGSPGTPPANAGVVPNKKITFPKPRKYITSRVSDRKEDAAMRSVPSPVPFVPLGSPLKDSSTSAADATKAEPSALPGSPKHSAQDPRQVLRAKRSKEVIFPVQGAIQNYAFSETPFECQWNEAIADGPSLTGWSRPSAEKVGLSRLRDEGQGPKGRQEEKRKTGGVLKVGGPGEGAKKEPKAGKKKGSHMTKKSPRMKEEPSAVGKAEKVAVGKGKEKPEKGTTLNMKEVVNVYKNLAYGSKEEIKSFVENLSFVKDESKSENDKNLLSMMNLKVLENKIKSFAKKSGKSSEASTSQEKKAKPERTLKKSRKAHIERLARHKVVKVPAVLNNNYLKSSVESPFEKTGEQRGKIKDKEPWKYVGMESVLDKTYFVYPAYPPSVNLKKATKGRKAGAKGTETSMKEKKGSADVSSGKVPEAEAKVKGPEVIVRPNLFEGGGRRSDGVKVWKSVSNKSMGRPSATTVCTVEFRPAVGQKAEEPPVGPTEQSLLVYLHGTKAIHVKSPYSDKQFSRVKFFRKDERAMPLIKGLGRRAPSRGGRNVSVRNISLPEKLTSVRSLDLLDFDEDIENITEFLRSQDTIDRHRPEECQGGKKRERDWWPRESPKDPDPAAARHQRRQRRTIHELHHHLSHLHLHHHQHGTSQGTFSPDSIVNEISKNIQHLQYLPDTEDNRKMIAHFFDELDQRIEASRKGTLALQKLPPPSGPESFRPIPILGY